MGVLSNLKPEKVFKYFEEISYVPRGSGNMEKIAEYMENFAKEHNLQCIKEPCCNIIIKKPASKGYENLPTVALQGHLDMVCEKNSDKVHDFEKDPLTLCIKDGFIYADGTTLGADCGIALAITLAILADDTLKHPPLEAIFTVNEETTMEGANELKAENVDSKFLINLDTSGETKVLVGCAGGAKVMVKLPVTKTSIHGEYLNAAIKIRGLQGGHSGEDADKNRGNANVLMGRVLYRLLNTMSFELYNLNGGLKNNAIPRECDANITISPVNKDLFEDIVKQMEAEIKNELKYSDPGFEIKIEYSDDKIENVFDQISKENVIFLLNTIPNGVMQMSIDIPGLVETSNNVGILRTEDGFVSYDNSVRSSINSQVKLVCDKIKILCEMTGSSYNLSNTYPSWQFNKESELLKIFNSTFKDISGKELESEAIHAGIECGVFLAKFPEMDMISIGPKMYDIHTPNEHLDYESTEKVYNFIVKVLENFKNFF